MAQGSSWNVARLSPVIMTAVIAILVCALLEAFTDIATGINILIAVIILALGLLGVWMLDRRGGTAT